MNNNQSAISSAVMTVKLLEAVNQNTIRRLRDDIPVYIHKLAAIESQKVIDQALSVNSLDVIEITKTAMLVGYIYAKAEQKIYLEEMIKDEIDG